MVDILKIIEKNKLLLLILLSLMFIFFVYKKQENINNLKQTPWSCDNGGYYSPMRVNSEGDIECMANDGTNCFWKNNADECKKAITDTKPEDIKPLACGDMHKSKYGGSGYDTSGHWCSNMANFMTIKAEQEAKIKAEQEAKIKADQDAKIKAEQEVKIKADQDAKIKADQDAAAKNKIYMILSSVCCCLCLIALAVVIIVTQKKSAKKTQTETQTETQTAT